MTNNILLDTGVLIKLRGRKFGMTVAKWLTAELPDARFFVSDISRYEFLRTMKNRTDLTDAVAFLRAWGEMEFGRDVIRAATHYYNVLTKEAKTRNGLSVFTMNQFSDTDIFIGATALQGGLEVCTTDGSDFPRPLFAETRRASLPNGEVIFLLAPDQGLFRRKLHALYGT